MRRPGKNENYLGDKFIRVYFIGNNINSEYLNKYPFNTHDENAPMYCNFHLWGNRG